MRRLAAVLLVGLCLTGCDKPSPAPESPAATPGYYEQLPPAPTACPTRVDPGLEPFYRHCPLRQGTP